MDSIVELSKREVNNDAPFPINWSPAPPQPKSTKRKRKKTNTSQSQWKRMSTRLFDGDIRAAKKGYNHEDNYTCGDSSLLALELPTNGLDPSLFPTCIPKQQSEEIGFGLFSLHKISEGNEIGEYIGEFVNKIPRDRSYLMDYLSMDHGKKRESLFIDARVNGNYMRFVNHSCDPNAEVHAAAYNGFERIIFVAKRDIAQHEFITIQYKEQPKDCKCGAKNCISKQKKAARSRSITK